MKTEGKPQPKESKLTPREQIFVREYLKDLNAKQAAHRAYPEQTIESAKTKGSKLLSKPTVADAIAKQFAERTEKVEIDVETVLRGLQDFALVNPADAFNDDGSLKNIHDMPVALQKSIASLDVDEIWDWEASEEGGRKHKVQCGETKKIKFWDKAKGLELLGKYLAMFIERQRLEDRDGNSLPPVQISFTGMGTISTHEQVVTPGMRF